MYDSQAQGLLGYNIYLKKEKKETLNHKLLANYYQKFNFFSPKNYKLLLKLIVKINIYLLMKNTF